MNGWAFFLLKSGQEHGTSQVINMKILVTGATGKLGSMVVEILLKSVPAINIAVCVRDPQKAQDLSALGVDVRYGDFNHFNSRSTKKG